MWISDGNADGNSLEKNVSISSDRMVASDSVSLPRLDNPTGACPAHRRQWADFLDLLRDVNTIFNFFCIRNRPDYSGFFLMQLYYILIYFHYSCIIDLQKLI